MFAHTAYGGEEIGLGGMVEGHYMQILYQLADTCAGKGRDITEDHISNIDRYFVDRRLAII